MSISDLVVAINNEKQALLSVLAAKGMDMHGVPFTEYHRIIEELPAASAEEDDEDDEIEKWEPHWYWSDGTKIDLHDADGTIPENTIRLLVDTRMGLRTYAFHVICGGGFSVKWGADVKEEYSETSVSEEGILCRHTFGLDYPERYAVVEFSCDDARYDLIGLKVDRQGYDYPQAVLWAVVNAPLSNTDAMFGHETCKKLESCEMQAVKIIGEGAFGGCNMLKNVQIPPSVSEIRGNAFGLCASLQSIVVPNCVLGPAVFSFCSSLAHVELAEGIQKLAGDTFHLCSKLRTLTIPSTVYELGDMAFYFCDSLMSITIPDGVLAIGFQTFGFCPSLESVTLPKGLLRIEDSAFSECKNLKTQVIPDNVEYIGNSAFSGCESLRSINLPTSITHIGDYAFSRCSSLRAMDLPKGIDRIESSLFSECKSLKRMQIPLTVTSIGVQAFRDCEMLGEISIPNSVTHIGDEAFSGCRTLHEIVLPESIVSIGRGLFESCGMLSKVVLPQSLKEFAFGNTMFSRCDSLSDVVYEGQFDSSVDGYNLFRDANMITKLDLRGTRWSRFKLSGEWYTWVNPLGQDGNIPGYDVPLLFDFESCDWGSTAPQIDLSYNALDAVQLNALFTLLAESGKFNGKTIKITGAIGAASCDKSIITKIGGNVIQ